MLMQLLAGVACLFAALLQFAVYRDPTIHDTHLRRMGRRIGLVGLLIGAMMAFHAFTISGPPNAVYLMLVLVGLGQTIFALSDLWPHLEKEHPAWTSRLNNSL